MEISLIVIVFVANLLLCGAFVPFITGRVRSVLRNRIFARPFLFYSLTSTMLALVVTAAGSLWMRDIITSPGITVPSGSVWMAYTAMFTILYGWLAVLGVTLIAMSVAFAVLVVLHIVLSRFSSYPQRTDANQDND